MSTAIFAISASKHGGQPVLIFERHRAMSRIFERMENFQNDCCRPWTKSLFKNSYSRLLRVVNAVVSLIASKSDD